MTCIRNLVANMFPCNAANDFMHLFCCDTEKPGNIALASTLCKEIFHLTHYFCRMLRGMTQMSFYLSSVRDSVSRIFRSCPPFQVVKFAICRIAIEVSALHALRTLT